MKFFECLLELRRYLRGSGRSPSRKPAGFRPGVECLEGRDLPAVSFSPAHRLSVTALQGRPSTGVLPVASIITAAAPAGAQVHSLPPVAPPGAAVASLEARLIVNQRTYSLDFGGKTPAEFRRLLDVATAALAALHQASGEQYSRLLDEAERSFAALPPAPAVDLTLEFRNTGSRSVQLAVGADIGELVLDLQGPGAVSGLPIRLMEYAYLRVPKPVTLAPGETYRLAVGSLDYGFRGHTRAYWTETGEYTLTVRYRTVVYDLPFQPTKGDLWWPPGGRTVTLTTAPVTLHVVAPRSVSRQDPPTADPIPHPGMPRPSWWDPVPIEFPRRLPPLPPAQVHSPVTSSIDRHLR